MNKKVRFVLICVICSLICVIPALPAGRCVYAQDQLTITTYYPSPAGSYDELETNKLVTNVAQGVDDEYADMQAGDVHIGRSLIVGASGSGFSYDELATAGNLPDDGDVLIKGNVGIATMSPTSKLEVVGTGGFDNDLTLTSYGMSAVGDTATFTARLARGTQASPSGVLANDRIGSINFFGHDGNTFYGPSAEIAATAEQNFIPGSRYNASLSFYTVNGITYDQRMVITSSGNVGIGTANPGNRLDVNGNIGLSSRIFPGILGTESGYSLVHFKGGTATNGGIIRASQADNDNPNAPLRFEASSFNFAGGNVGIGTAGPAQKLEVSNVMRLTPTDSPGTCDASKKGSIYYDDSSNELCYCNGGSWAQVDGESGGC